MSQPLLSIAGLSKRFAVGKRKLIGKHDTYLHAVDDVSFDVQPGQSIGLVGESGCGKSTLVRLVTRLLDASAGSIRFGNDDLGAIPAADFAARPERALIQMVFQDPTDSLNPRYTAFDTIAEPIRLLTGETDTGKLRARVEEAAQQVGLPSELLTRFPHQLSGGQKARVGIARAIAVRPKLLILDEPTAALDVSVQAVVLQLLDKLRRELGVSYLFVSHDLNVVRLLCDRVMVMYLGRVVEEGPAQEVFEHPQHPYTRALVSSIPHLDAACGKPVERDPPLAGEPQSPINPDPECCRFASRCPKVQLLCKGKMPLLQDCDEGHRVACHFPGQAPATEAPANLSALRRTGASALS